MKLDDQIALIKSQKPIDDIPVEDRRQVFARAVYLFRKYIGPMNDPSALEKNLKRIMMLCRLPDDEESLALVLGARAIAQIDNSAKPGEHDDLLRACGLDLTDSSTTAYGVASQKHVMVNATAKIDESFVVNFRGQTISIVGGAMTGEHDTDDFADACRTIDRLNTRGGGHRYIELDYRESQSGDEIEIFDTVHDPWRPTSIYSDRLKKHPTQIIEPSTLAATPYPDPTYKPMLPVEAIERGFVSDAQFECVTYALQAITAYLPGSPMGPRGPRMKGGFIIGDGTGVGKTNEFCAVIMDQTLRGKTRHIVVVERSKHVKHIGEGWQMIGGDPRNVMFQGERHATEPLPSRNGIMVTTYALLRDERRYRALLDWANENETMDGVLVFDEAHNMRNAVEDEHKEGAGKRNQSQQGMAGVDLQLDLPKAGVIYTSATMATDVYNLGYAVRLGLWGEGAPFESTSHFINEMHSLDEAALEQICIDLKSAGRYCSRNLSFEGVEYEELEHRLTPRQRERFDQTVRTYRTYSNMVAAALKACTNGKITTHGNFNDFIRAQRNTVETLLTNFNVETLIRDIHEELAQGNAPVIQISMTGEARMMRVIGDRKEMTIEEYRDDALRNYIESHFPIHRRVKRGKDWVVDTDGNGDPIEVPEAVRLRDEAYHLANDVALSMNAIDRIYLEFGADMVAEMTGRSARVLPRMDKGKHVGWYVEERSSKAASEDVHAFQEGRKSILLFSLGAGGTGLSYHASPEVRNKARRVHYILELGRRAESAVQGIGRTHRAGQIEPPIVKMLVSDIPAHTIYASKTLAKIQKMGALSRGHQHATSNAIFEQRIPLHTIYAERGWKSLLAAVQREEIEGIKESELQRDLGLEPKDMGKFDMVLSRLAVLTDGEQRQLVDELRHRTEEAMASAMRNGSYNQGMETIRAESIEIIDENTIENGNGSRTNYYRLVRHDKITKTEFSRAAMLMSASRKKKNIKAVFMRHKVNGRIVLGVAREGGVMVDVTSPGGTITRRVEAIRSEPWKLIADMDEARRYWELEYENMDTEETSELHMLSGSLLYNWDKLPKNGIGLTRCKVKTGEVIVGRLIGKYDIKKTLQDLGMRSNYSAPQIASMLKRIEAGAELKMDNGWSIDLPQGETDYRLNVPDAEQTGRVRRMLADMGVNEVSTPLGAEFSIERAKAIDVIQRLAIGSDLELTGTLNAANSGPNTAAMAAMVQILP